MEIINGFLGQQEFAKLQTLVMASDKTEGFQHILWGYNDVIVDNNDIDKFQFVHIFYSDDVPFSPFLEKLNPMLDRIQATSLWRIKANLHTRTPNIIENKFHVDMLAVPEEKLKHWTTSIFYINTNNGYTEFEDGTKVESVANRMVTFPSNLKHRGTSCTDEKIRVVINFNYFK